MRYIYCTAIALFVLVSLSTAETVRYFDLGNGKEYSEDEISIVYTEKENGKVVSEGFATKEGRELTKVIEMFAVYRIDWKFDDFGRKIEGECFRSRNGEFDETDSIILIRYEYGMDGKLDREIRGVKLGYDYSEFGEIRQIVYGYDSEGRIVSKTHYSSQNDPILRNGYHRLNHVYDNSGNVLSESYFGIGGEPIISNRLFKTHEVMKEYDENDNLTNERFYGTEQEPIENRNGVHSIKRVYDDSGNVLSKSYFGIKGEPSSESHNPSVHKVEYSYYRDNNKSELKSESVYGVNNEPVVNDSWDIMYYDNFAELMMGGGSRVESVHRIEKEFDEDGVYTSVAFYDINDEPAQDEKNIHRIEYKWLKERHPTSIIYMNYTGDLIYDNWPGYVWLERIYDDEGWILEQALYGENKEPLSFNNGVHKECFCGEVGYKRTRVCYNTDNEPIEGSFHMEGK